MTLLSGKPAASANPNHRHSVIVCVFSALVLVSAWTTIAAMLRWQWQETMAAEKRQNANIALALSEHTLRILQTVDKSMQRLQDHVKDRPFDGREIVRIANETGMTPEILTQLSFVAANGDFQGSNLDPDGSRSQHVNLMEREHIRVHLQPAAPSPGTSAGLPPDGLFVSRALQGKVSGVWTIQLSRKITAADGRTLGVVVASLNQAYFDKVYGQVGLGSDGGVALVGLDGVIRARVAGGASAQAGRSISEPLKEKLQQAPSGATVSSSSLGMNRIVGYSRVGNYPLTVLSSSSHEQAFAGWRATRNAVLLLAALLSLVVVGFVATVLVNVRRMANSHAALARSEAYAQRANQAKSEFLAAMSHELRTPLTSIRGFAELMELRSGDPVVREQSSLIRQGAEHLNALLTEILDLAKIEAGATPTHNEPIQLRALVRELTDLFRVSAMAKGLTLHLTIAAQTPPILTTDALKLKQILSNLLSNAIKFTPEGYVSVKVEPSADSSHVLLHVTDTGPGIPAELQEKIFEKFSQGNARVSYQHGGTGLGLALSRALAQLLGGALVVVSRPGEGARFTLSLPCADLQPGRGEHGRGAMVADETTESAAPVRPA